MFPLNRSYPRSEQSQVFPKNQAVTTPDRFCGSVSDEAFICPIEQLPLSLARTPNFHLNVCIFQQSHAETSLPGAYSTSSTDDAATHRTPAGTEAILLVDDQPTVREFAVEALTEWGYRVIGVASTEEALQILGDLSIPLAALVTDVTVPAIGGVQLATEAKRLRPGLKVLFVSGLTEQDVIGGKATDDDLNFLEKPFGPEELARSLRQTLDRRGSPKSTRPEEYPKFFSPRTNGEQ